VVSIGAKDVVDGNPSLMLGLIWTIILHYHIRKIEFEVVSCGRTFCSWTLCRVSEHKAEGEGTAVS
jgi:hypothetical protein